MRFFQQMLKGICTLILDYREMYWFRDFHPLDTISSYFAKDEVDEGSEEDEESDDNSGKITRNVGIKKSNMSGTEESIAEETKFSQNSPSFISSFSSARNKQKILGTDISPSRSRIPDLMKRIDTYVGGRYANLCIETAEMKISFLENIDVKDKARDEESRPFFVFTIPASHTSLINDKDCVKASMFGFTMTSYKSTSFISIFLTVSFSAHILLYRTQRKFLKDQ